MQPNPKTDPSNRKLANLPTVLNPELEYENPPLDPPPKKTRRITHNPKLVSMPQSRNLEAKIVQLPETVKLSSPETPELPGRGWVPRPNTQVQDRVGFRRPSRGRKRRRLSEMGVIPLGMIFVYIYIYLSIPFHSIPFHSILFYYIII